MGLLYIQGMLNLYQSTPYDVTLSVMAGSYLYHDLFFDGIRYDEPEADYRTFHQGIEAPKGIDSMNHRMVVQCEGFDNLRVTNHWEQNYFLKCLKHMADR